MIVDLHLKNRLVIIVGSGAEGLGKINTLLTQNCSILVISATKTEHIQKLIDDGSIKFEQHRLENVTFLDKYDPILIMATTNDKELNKKIVSHAKRMNCYGYASDDPNISDFSHPSVINLHNTVQIAVSTGGKSPAVARNIRMRAQKIFNEVVTSEDIDMIHLQDISRRAAKNIINKQQDRKKFLYTIMNDSEIKQLLVKHNLSGAQERMRRLLGDWK